MKAKTNRVKWTKKFKALIISLSLVFAVALGGACAAIGLTVENNRRFGGSLAGGAADENVPQLPEAAATFYAGATVDDVTYTTNAEAWAAAVKYSVDNTAVVKFDLKSNWTAKADTNGFATDAAKAISSDAYGVAGSLNVPEGANVILNISKNAKLDRNLADAAGAETSKAIENGEVITNNATLYVTGNGTITGGNTTGNGGGIYSTGLLTITGGKIQGNKATSGGGVAVFEGGTFNLGGRDGDKIIGTAEICNNSTTRYGGGVYVLTEELYADETVDTGATGTADATFNMYSGKICGNVADYGHGLTFMGSRAYANMYGGVITNNVPLVAPAKGHYCDTVFVCSGAQFIMNGGEICNENGGSDVVRLLNSVKAAVKPTRFIMNGGSIHDNNVVNNIASFGAVMLQGRATELEDEAEIAKYPDSGKVSAEIGGTARIYNNKGGNGAGVFATINSSLTITGGEISNNTATANGGGIWSAGAGEKNEDGTIKTAGLTISGGTLENNKATDGGAIYLPDNGSDVSGSTAIVSNVQILNNTTTGTGAGVYVSVTSTANFTGCTFTGNEAGTTGGGIALKRGGYVNVDGCTFTKNKAYNDVGGGIDIENLHTSTTGHPIAGCLEVHRSTFTDNWAQHEGGAINSRAHSYMIIGSENDPTDVNTFRNNDTLYGGAIRTQHIHVYNAVFENNNALYEGGGIRVVNMSEKALEVVDGEEVETDPTNYFVNCIFRNNSASCGGGICTFNWQMTYTTNNVVTGCTFENNTATLYGGGLDVRNTGMSATVTGNTFTNNKAAYGGGIYANVGANMVKDSNVSISNCTVTGNESIYEGGGMYLGAYKYSVTSGSTTTSSPYTAHITVTNTPISDNKAGTGGGIYHYVTDNGGAATVTGCEITNNAATNGGGIYNVGNMTLTGVAVTDNNALNNGGGVYDNGTFAFKGSAKIDITGNTAYKWTHNLFVKKDRSIGLYVGATNVAVGVSVENPGQNFIIGSNVALTYNNTGAENGYFPDDTTNYQIVQTTRSNLYDYALNSKITGTLEDRWYNAVMNSSDSNPQIFDMTGDWKAATGGSYGTRFTSNASYMSAIDVYDKPFTGYGALCVPKGKNVILRLNGYTLDRALTAIWSGGHVINLQGTLTILGEGTIKGGNTGIGGGIAVSGNLIMNGGTITGCNASNEGGGGVGIYGDGKFTMNGGTITGNTATGTGCGGGVYVSGAFTMNGGSIDHNMASVTEYNTLKGGGGIYMAVGSTCNLLGGRINYNTTTGSGGAIQLMVGSSSGNVTTTLNMGAKAEDGTLSGTVQLAGNVASGNGGAINDNGAGKAVMNLYGGTISSNTSHMSGGAIAYSSTFNMEGGEISGNVASPATGKTSVGGALFANNKAVTTIKGGEIFGNVAYLSTDSKEGLGAAIYNNGTLIISGGKIMRNAARGSGGAIFSRGALTMTGGEISFNTAAYNGGGIDSEGTLNISGGSIERNTATGNGGGIAVKSANPVYITGTAQIFRNTSGANGGGIAIYADTTVNIDGAEVKISNNTAKVGGGLYMLPTGGAVLKNGSISHNVTTGNGGGMYVNNGSFTMTGGEIAYNNAGAAGGAIDGSAYDSVITFSGGKIHHNTSNAHGGALSIGATATDHASVTVSGTVEIYENESKGGQFGGGLYIEGGVTLTMTGGKIYNNKTVGDGGGIRLNSISTTSGSTTTVKVAKAVISGGEIYGNEAGTYGGGICSAREYDEIVIRGGSITNNVTGVGGITGGGGGIFINGTLEMFDGDISYNMSYSKTYGAGGIMINNPAKFTMHNGTITHNTADLAGGGIANWGILVIEDGVISDNYSGRQGGGLYITDDANLSRGKIFINGGAIANNTAVGNGGGLYLRASVNISNCTISGNTAYTAGGGFYAVGNTEITMNSGTISYNTAKGYGGGVHVEMNAKFTMNDGVVVSNNTIEGTAGAGVEVDGTFIMNGGRIINNTNNGSDGGGGVGVYWGTFTMKNGEISGNTALFGGGVYVKAEHSFTMEGGTITGNTATKNGGGVYVEGTFNLSGSVHIEDNLSDGAENNVYVCDGSKIIVTGALANGSLIGLTTDGTLPYIATSGFGSKMGSNAQSLARNIFSADEEGYVVVYENSEVVLKQGVVLTVQNDNGDKIGSITTVANATVTGSFNEETRVYTLVESGAVANDSGFAFASEAVPAGYAAYMYAYGDVNKTEITSVTIGTDNPPVRLTKKALTRNYTIHYYLQNADGTYGETYVTGTHSGLTDSNVVVLGQDGNPFTTQIPTPEQYSLDETHNEWKSVTVSGDGNTVVDVYLKLNEYSIVFNAGTAGTQRFTARYGAKLSSLGVREPSKLMNEFKGWYTDEACTDGNEVDLDAYSVTENVTLYAKFDTRSYTVTFNLNLGSDEAKKQLDTSRALYRTAEGDEWLENGYIEWKASGVSGLFDDTGVMRDQDKFNFHKVSEGVYEISYNINNIPQLKRLTIEPKAIGYDFTGWYVSETATSKTTIIRAPKAAEDESVNNITLTARWEPTEYSIRLDKRNGQRITTITVPNFSLWGSGELDGGHLNGVLPKNPTRDGYIFSGWYASADMAAVNETDFDIYSSSTIGGGDKETACFNLINFTQEYLEGVYGNAIDGYNFANLTLYAGWQRETVTIVDETDEELQDTQGYVRFINSLGNEITRTYVGETIRLELNPQTGYDFDYITVNGVRKTVTDDGVNVGVLGEDCAVKKFTLLARDVIRQNGTMQVKIVAVYKAKAYNIRYYYPGATADMTGYGNIYSYTIANVSEGGTPFYLPSKLIKRGYNFMGWQFRDETPAFDASGLGDLNSYYDKQLPLVAPRNADGEVEYRDLELTAIWEAQPAPVTLYYASYAAGSIGYEEVEKNTTYRINERSAGVAVKTGDEIEIVNPERASFNFLGWATSRGGAVVYPVDGEKGTITYTVNPDKDENGEAMNRNNLYAVWHVAGVDYVNITAKGNESTYTHGGEGISMTAMPSNVRAPGDGETIGLRYYWYKVYNYDACFKLEDYEDNQGRKLYVDENGNVMAYLNKDNTITAVDGGTLGEPEANWTIYQYKVFKFDEIDALKAAGYLEEKANSGNTLLAPTQSSKYTVHEVSDCGTYVCYVVVSGSVGGEQTTTEGSFGEIEIKMNKADFDGVTVADKQVSYNGESRADEMFVTVANGATKETIDGVTYITLPDSVVNGHAGSKLIVTYRYYTGVGTARQEITDLTKIRNVGTYYVVASFVFTPDGDNGNYELIQPIEAVLEITPYQISNLKYTFTHEGTAVEGGEFSGVYDGQAYAVKAEITDNINGSDVTLTTKVYTIDESTYNETEFNGAATVNVGNYALVVTGLGGADTANFALSETAKLRQEYAITVAKYDFADSIEFVGGEETYDGKMHTLEISMKDGKTLPETVKVTYTREYTALVDGYNPTDNMPDKQNGGKYAGVYTVTAKFTDETNGANYEPIGDMTATLVINRENLFTFHNVDGKDLLRDGGFVSASNKYIVGTAYDPYISSGILAGSDFSVTYEYYSVNETDGTKALLGNGTHAQLEGQKLITEAGKYEIIAKITYVSDYYSNNFEAVQDEEATITYVIREVDVESVTITEWADGVTDASGNIVKKLKLGEAFDYTLIKKIEVEYATGSGIREITGDNIRLVTIIYEADGATERNDLWHVGNFKIKVSVYGKESEEYTFKVVESVADYELQYSVDGGNSYEPVPAEGLERREAGEEPYKFIVVFDAATANSATKVSMDLNATYTNLVLGENTLTLADSESAESANYELGAVKVNIYKIFTGSEIVWKYQVDGGELQEIGDDPVLPYIGKEYKIFATFTDDGTEQMCETETESGKAVLNASNYMIVVKDGGKYMLNVDSYSLAVEPRKLAFDWTANAQLVYNTHFQTPTAAITNLCDIDEGLISLSYIYRDVNGNRLDAPSDEVVNVGEYTVEVYGLSGDAADNYTLVGAENASFDFTIAKADVGMTAEYNEYNYGKNVTYAGNIQGLRLDAVRADFGTNTVVAGRFVFIKDLQADGTYTEVAGDSADVKALLATAATDVKVPYAYIPVDTNNYNIKTGNLNLNVLEQRARSGADSLSVELGEGSKSFYLVGNTFSTVGIKVNRLYQSTYIENGKWYGYRQAVNNPTFLIGSINLANSDYVISATDVSNREIVLTAKYGSSSGTLNVHVLNDTPTGVSIVNAEELANKSFYVGEPYDYDDITFEVTFETSAPQRFNNASGVVSLKEPVTFTDGDVANGKVVTFKLFDMECNLTVKVKEASLITFKGPANKVYTHTGEVLELPKITYIVDGAEYDELEGVSIDMERTQVLDEQYNPAEFKNDGTYTIRYYFTKTNYAYKLPASPEYFELRDVRITSNPYTVTITVPEDGVQTTYDSNAHEIPKPSISEVTDALHGNETVDGSKITVRYQIYRTGASVPPATATPNWTVTNVGTYNVVVSVFVEGYTESIGTATYTYSIAQAENAITEFDVPEYVIFEDETLYDFGVKATFDANKKVLTFSKNANGPYTEALPDSTGIWYVKATIAGTDNYKEVTTEAKFFDVRTKSISSGDNTVSGGDGVGADWTLEVNPDDVSEISLSQQEILGGYRVELKDRTTGNVVTDAENDYTVRIKLTDELAEKKNMKVFFYDSEGKATAVQGVKVDADGYLEFKTKSFGRFVLSEEIPVDKGPMILLIVVIVLGVVAAAGIAACVVVFLKKRKGGNK